MRLILIAVLAISFAEAKYCDFPCARLAVPVCGHDGKTYSNECVMRREACERGEAIVKVYDGSCKEVSDACYSLCPAISRPVCGSNRKYYSNKCILQQAACKEKKAIILVKHSISYNNCLVCNIPCPRMARPVCGNDGKTYSNECVMRREACKKRKAIVKVYNGFCEGTVNSTNQCNFPCSRMARPVCGNDGKTYSNECRMRREACIKKQAIMKVSDGRCVKTKCNFPCQRMALPICGHDGRTYMNECIMRRNACKTKKAIVKAYDGYCKNDPNACHYNCSTTWRPVCGSDHLLYSNECVLQRVTCKQKRAIVPVKSYDTNDDCSKCDIACREIYGPTCGSDGNFYSNECEMKRAACKRKQAIIKVFHGKCN